LRVIERSPVSSSTQHGIDLAEPFHDIPTKVGAHAGGVPFRLAQQVLQAIGRVVASVLGLAASSLGYCGPAENTRDRTRSRM
jgi:hypothetical protein